MGFNGILTLANIVVTRSYPPVCFYIAKSMIASPSEMTYILVDVLLSMSKFAGEYDMCIHVGIWMDMEHEDT